MLTAFRSALLTKRYKTRLGEALVRLSARLRRSKINHIKIYGERNTGTRFLSALLIDNFSTPSLNGSFRAVAAKTERNSTRSLVKEQRQVLKIVVEDKLLTLHHPDHIAKTFGWKHASPPIDYLKSVPERAAQTLFIVLVKHPVYWALSFHKRPYHTYFPATRALSFHDFLHHIFIPSGRDNVSAAVYQSAIELYAAKVDGYRKLAEVGVPFELIRYEEMLEDVPGTLERFATKYGLPRRHKEWLIQSGSTKEKETSLADYRSKYRLDRIGELVPREDYEFIIATFGPERLAWLGYRNE